MRVRPLFLSLGLLMGFAGPPASAAALTDGNHPGENPAVRGTVPGETTAQAVVGAASLPAAQSPASSAEARQKTLEAFKSTADAWRNGGSRVDLPEEADRHRILAEAAFNEKDVERALRHFKAALEIYPTWPQGQFNLAVLCGETKNYECAYVHMNEYMLLAPDAPDARAAYEKTVIWEDKLENPEPSGPSIPVAAPPAPARVETATAAQNFRVRIKLGTLSYPSGFLKVDDSGISCGTDNGKYSCQFPIADIAQAFETIGDLGTRHDLHIVLKSGKRYEFINEANAGHGTEGAQFVAHVITFINEAQQHK